VFLQETKVTWVTIEEILSWMHHRYEVIALDASGSEEDISILWNPTEILFYHCINMPYILYRIFRHIRVREWVLLSKIYNPHILGEREAFLHHLGKIRTE